MVSVVEPRVAFDRARIDFGRVLVGGVAQLALTLVNSEPQPFHFDLDRVSLGDLSANPAGSHTSSRPCITYCQIEPETIPCPQTSSPLLPACEEYFKSL